MKKTRRVGVVSLGYMEFILGGLYYPVMFFFCFWFSMAQVFFFLGGKCIL